MATEADFPAPISDTRREQGDSGNELLTFEGENFLTTPSTGEALCKIVSESGKVAGKGDQAAKDDPKILLLELVGQPLEIAISEQTSLIQKNAEESNVADGKSIELVASDASENTSVGAMNDKSGDRKTAEEHIVCNLISDMSEDGKCPDDSNKVASEKEGLANESQGNVEDDEVTDDDNLKVTKETEKSSLIQIHGSQVESDKQSEKDTAKSLETEVSTGRANGNDASDDLNVRNDKEGIGKADSSETGKDATALLEKPVESNLDRNNKKTSSLDEQSAEKEKDETQKETFESVSDKKTEELLGSAETTCSIPSASESNDNERMVRHEAKIEDGQVKKTEEHTLLEKESKVEEEEVVLHAAREETKSSTLDQEQQSVTGGPQEILNKKLDNQTVDALTREESSENVVATIVLNEKDEESSLIQFDGTQIKDKELSDKESETPYAIGSFAGNANKELTLEDEVSENLIRTELQEKENNSDSAVLMEDRLQVKCESYLEREMAKTPTGASPEKQIQTADPLEISGGKTKEAYDEAVDTKDGTTKVLKTTEATAPQEETHNEKEGATAIFHEDAKEGPPAEVDCSKTELAEHLKEESESSFPTEDRAADTIEDNLVDKGVQVEKSTNSSQDTCNDVQTIPSNHITETSSIKEEISGDKTEQKTRDAENETILELQENVRNITNEDDGENSPAGEDGSHKSPLEESSTGNANDYELMTVHDADESNTNSELVKNEKNIECTLEKEEVSIEPLQVSGHDAKASNPARIVETCSAEMIINKDAEEDNEKPSTIHAPAGYLTESSSVKEETRMKKSTDSIQVANGDIGESTSGQEVGASSITEQSVTPDSQEISIAKTEGETIDATPVIRETLEQVKTGQDRETNIREAQNLNAEPQEITSHCKEDVTTNATGVQEETNKDKEGTTAVFNEDDKEKSLVQVDCSKTEQTEHSKEDSESSFPTENPTGDTTEDTSVDERVQEATSSISEERINLKSLVIEDTPQMKCEPYSEKETVKTSIQASTEEQVQPAEPQEISGDIIKKINDEAVDTKDGSTEDVAINVPIQDNEESLQKPSPKEVSTSSTSDNEPTNKLKAKFEDEASIKAELLEQEKITERDLVKEDIPVESLQVAVGCIKMEQTEYLEKGSENPLLTKTLTGDYAEFISANEEVQVEKTVHALQDDCESVKALHSNRNIEASSIKEEILGDKNEEKTTDAENEMILELQENVRNSKNEDGEQNPPSGEGGLQKQPLEEASAGNADDYKLTTAHNAEHADERITNSDQVKNEKVTECALEKEEVPLEMLQMSGQQDENKDVEKDSEKPSSIQAQTQYSTESSSVKEETQVEKFADSFKVADEDTKESTSGQEVPTSSIDNQNVTPDTQEISMAKTAGETTDATPVTEETHDEKNVADVLRGENEVISQIEENPEEIIDEHKENKRNDETDLKEETLKDKEAATGIPHEDSKNNPLIQVDCAKIEPTEHLEKESENSFEAETLTENTTEIILVNKGDQVEKPIHSLQGSGNDIKGVLSNQEMESSFIEEQILTAGQREISVDENKEIAIDAVYKDETILEQDDRKSISSEYNEQMSLVGEDCLQQPSSEEASTVNADDDKLTTVQDAIYADENITNPDLVKNEQHEECDLGKKKVPIDLIQVAGKDTKASASVRDIETCSVEEPIVDTNAEGIMGHQEVDIAFNAADSNAETPEAKIREHEEDKTSNVTHSNEEAPEDKDVAAAVTHEDTEESSLSERDCSQVVDEDIKMSTSGQEAETSSIEEQIVSLNPQETSTAEIEGKTVYATTTIVETLDEQVKEVSVDSTGEDDSAFTHGADKNTVPAELSEKNIDGPSVNDEVSIESLQVAAKDVVPCASSQDTENISSLEEESLLITPEKVIDEHKEHERNDETDSKEEVPENKNAAITIPQEVDIDNTQGQTDFSQIEHEEHLEKNSENPSLLEQPKEDTTKGILVKEEDEMKCTNSMQIPNEDIEVPASSRDRELSSIEEKIPTPNCQEISHAENAGETKEAVGGKAETFIVQDIATDVPGRGSVDNSQVNPDSSQGPYQEEILKGDENDKLIIKHESISLQEELNVKENVTDKTDDKVVSEVGDDTTKDKCMEQPEGEGIWKNVLDDQKYTERQVEEREDKQESVLLDETVEEIKEPTSTLAASNILPKSSETAEVYQSISRMEQTVDGEEQQTGKATGDEAEMKIEKEKDKDEEASRQIILNSISKAPDESSSFSISGEDQEVESTSIEKTSALSCRTDESEHPSLESMVRETSGSNEAECANAENRSGNESEQQALKNIVQVQSHDLISAEAEKDEESLEAAVEIHNERTLTDDISSKKVIGKDSLKEEMSKDFQEAVGEDVEETEETLLTYKPINKSLHQKEPEKSFEEVTTVVNTEGSHQADHVHTATRTEDSREGVITECHQEDVVKQDEINTREIYEIENNTNKTEKVSKFIEEAVKEPEDNFVEKETNGNLQKKELGNNVQQVPSILDAEKAHAVDHQYAESKGEESREAIVTESDREGKIKQDESSTEEISEDKTIRSETEKVSKIAEEPSDESIREPEESRTESIDDVATTFDAEEIHGEDNACIQIKTEDSGEKITTESHHREDEENRKEMKPEDIISVTEDADGTEKASKACEEATEKYVQDSEENVSPNVDRSPHHNELGKSIEEVANVLDTKEGNWADHVNTESKYGDSKEVIVTACRIEHEVEQREANTEEIHEEGNDADGPEKAPKVSEDVIQAPEENFVAARKSIDRSPQQKELGTLVATEEACGTDHVYQETETENSRKEILTESYLECEAKQLEMNTEEICDIKKIASETEEVSRPVEESFEKSVQEPEKNIFPNIDSVHWEDNVHTERADCLVEKASKDFEEAAGEDRKETKETLLTNEPINESLPQKELEKSFEEVTSIVDRKEAHQADHVHTKIRTEDSREGVVTESPEESVVKEEEINTREIYEVKNRTNETEKVSEIIEETEENFVKKEAIDGSLYEKELGNNVQQVTSISDAEEAHAVNHQYAETKGEESREVITTESNGGDKIKQDESNTEEICELKWIGSETEKVVKIAEEHSKERVRELEESRSESIDDVATTSNAEEIRGKNNACIETKTEDHHREVEVKPNEMNKEDILEERENAKGTEKESKACEEATEKDAQESKENVLANVDRSAHQNELGESIKEVATILDNEEDNQVDNVNVQSKFEDSKEVIAMETHPEDKVEDKEANTEEISEVENNADGTEKAPEVSEEAVQGPEENFVASHESVDRSEQQEELGKSIKGVTTLVAAEEAHGTGHVCLETGTKDSRKEIVTENYPECKVKQQEINTEEICEDKRIASETEEVPKIFEESSEKSVQKPEDSIFANVDNADGEDNIRTETIEGLVGKENISANADRSLQQRELGKSVEEATTILNTEEVHGEDNSREKIITESPCGDELKPEDIFEVTKSGNEGVCKEASRKAVEEPQKLLKEADAIIATSDIEQDSRVDHVHRKTALEDSKEEVASSTKVEGNRISADGIDSEMAKDGGLSNQHSKLSVVDAAEQQPETHDENVICEAAPTKTIDETCEDFEGKEEKADTVATEQQEEENEGIHEGLRPSEFTQGKESEKLSQEDEDGNLDKAQVENEENISLSEEKGEDDPQKAVTRGKLTKDEDRNVYAEMEKEILEIHPEVTVEPQEINDAKANTNETEWVPEVFGEAAENNMDQEEENRGKHKGLPHGEFTHGKESERLGQEDEVCNSDEVQVGNEENLLLSERKGKEDAHKADMCSKPAEDEDRNVCAGVEKVSFSYDGEETSEVSHASGVQDIPGDDINADNEYSGENSSNKITESQISTVEEDSNQREQASKATGVTAEIQETMIRNDPNPLPESAEVGSQQEGDVSNKSRGMIESSTSKEPAKTLASKIVQEDTSEASLDAKDQLLKIHDLPQESHAEDSEFKVAQTDGQDLDQVRGIDDGVKDSSGCSIGVTNQENLVELPNENKEVRFSSDLQGVKDIHYVPKPETSEQDIEEKQLEKTQNTVPEAAGVNSKEEKTIRDQYGDLAENSGDAETETVSEDKNQGQMLIASPPMLPHTECLDIETTKKDIPRALVGLDDTAVTVAEAFTLPAKDKHVVQEVNHSKNVNPEDSTSNKDISVIQYEDSTECHESEVKVLKPSNFEQDGTKCEHEESADTKTTKSMEKSEEILKRSDFEEDEAKCMHEESTSQEIATSVEKSELKEIDEPSLSGSLQATAKETIHPDTSKEPTVHIDDQQVAGKHGEAYHDCAKIDEEGDDDEESNEHKRSNLGSEAPVTVDPGSGEVKVAHKKSHGILSGVGSKVKHSISKVKKAITGKSSHSKSSSPT